MIIMLDEGFGQKQLQQYLNDYNFILDLWLETFVNLPVAKDERKHFDLCCSSWMVSFCLVSICFKIDVSWNS
jgi:hypothetical protein